MIKTLQLGRGLAAVSVIAFHLSYMMASPKYGGQAILADYTRHGHYGVEFFFVLSGFIILFAHINDLGRPQALGTFLYRRFVRLFPTYWLYTAILTGMILLGLGNSSIPATVEGWFSALTLVRIDGSAPPLAPAWSLFHEVVFYLVFSILILNFRLGLLAFALFVCTGLFLQEITIEGHRTPLSVYGSVYNVFFVFGMAAYKLYQRAGNGVPELVAGAALVWAAFWLASGDNSLTRPVVVGLGFALLLAGITKFERAGYIGVPKFFVYLGDASYSVYLIQIPVMGAMLKLMRKAQEYTELSPYVVYVIVLVATTAIGCCAYSVIERHIMSQLRRREKSAAALPIQAAKA
jgi:peptidoglycan/LPS O-acetylase OafA/YrhL